MWPEPGEQHSACVVSVGMLTEGWDARNVTHIFAPSVSLTLGGSLLLCRASDPFHGRLRRTAFSRYWMRKTVFQKYSGYVFGVSLTPSLAAMTEEGQAHLSSDRKRLASFTLLPDSGPDSASTFPTVARICATLRRSSAGT